MIETARTIKMLQWIFNGPQFTRTVEQVKRQILVLHLCDILAPFVHTSLTKIAVLDPYFYKPMHVWCMRSIK